MIYPEKSPAAWQYRFSPSCSRWLDSSPSVGRTTAKAAGCGFSKSRQRRPRPMLVRASTGPDSVTNDEIKSRCQLRGTKVSKTSSA
jgi:hypothetical protein